MSIKDTKTRVTFVTEIETKEAIEQMVNESRQAGCKMTLSKYIDAVLQEHIENTSAFDALFKSNLTT